MEDNDELTFLVEFDEDFTHFMLTLISPTPMVADDVLKSFESLLDDIRVNPEEYFRNAQKANLQHH